MVFSLEEGVCAAALLLWLFGCACYVLIAYWRYKREQRKFDAAVGRLLDAAEARMRAVEKHMDELRYRMTESVPEPRGASGSHRGAGSVN
jgi:hypothetical protein